MEVGGYFLEENWGVGVGVQSKTGLSPCLLYSCRQFFYDSWQAADNPPDVSIMYCMATDLALEAAVAPEAPHFAPVTIVMVSVVRAF